MKPIEYRSATLWGDFYENTGKPLAVLIGGSKRGIPDVSPMLLAYLTERYNVLVLAYFGETGLKPHLDRIPLEYFINAINAIQSKTGVADSGVTVIGSSKGGELALLLISRYFHPGRTIACVPSRYVWQAIPYGPFSMIFPHSSWMFDGIEIPYLKFRYSPAIIRDLREKKYVRCHEKGIVQKKDDRAAIDLSAYQGKLLLLSSRTDPYWPSAFMCEEIAAKGNINVSHKILPLTGHYFLAYEESAKEIINFLEKA